MSATSGNFVHAELVVLSDTVDQPNTIEAFVPGANGNVNAVLMDGTAVLFTGCLAGHIYPVKCRRINNTSTTSSAIVALGDGVPTIRQIGASG